MLISFAVLPAITTLHYYSFLMIKQPLRCLSKKNNFCFTSWLPCVPLYSHVFFFSLKNFHYYFYRKNLLLCTLLSLLYFNKNVHFPCHFFKSYLTVYILLGWSLCFFKCLRNAVHCLWDAIVCEQKTAGILFPVSLFGCSCAFLQWCGLFITGPNNVVAGYGLSCVAWPPSPFLLQLPPSILWGVWPSVPGWPQITVLLPPLCEDDKCGPSHVFRVSWVFVYWTSGSVALVCMGFQLFVQIFMMSFFLLASYDMDKVITDFNVPVYSEICDIFRVYLNCIFSSLWLILACFFTCLAIF